MNIFSSSCLVQVAHVATQTKFDENENEGTNVSGLDIRTPPTSFSENENEGTNVSGLDIRTPPTSFDENENEGRNVKTLPQQCYEYENKGISMSDEDVRTPSMEFKDENDSMNTSKSRTASDVTVEAPLTNFKEYESKGTNMGHEHGEKRPTYSEGTKTKRNESEDDSKF